MPTELGQHVPAAHVGLDVMHDVRVAATKLGWTPATVRKKLLTREIAYFKVGRSVRISEKTIQEILRKAYRPALPAIGGNRVA